MPYIQSKLHFSIEFHYNTIKKRMFLFSSYHVCVYLKNVA